MKTQGRENRLPMAMKFEGKYETYENGKKREDVVMKADYDGKDLEVNVNDRVKNQSTYLQLTNDELFDLMAHRHTEKSLMSQLEDELHTKKNEGRIKRVKKGRKTQRKRVIGRKGKKGKKRQTRRRK